ncbi:AraC family transcriptional regulator [Clostridium sp. CS001]|uniref:AraC family transcriptional regulator n=1 Tax=Clostridium sp. CS001 TaxID=2880648 RepID=UPI001CF5E9E2|nr:AraC family transcriptional regulator [Clostridium sp. CS001]MCB2290940.1 AraC family transcriptional regulator [Clostridium sp. CS001]
MKKLEKVNAASRMQDYIEDHISEQITLYMLAKSAGYSPWHSARIFKELLGKSPFEYIRSLRLSLAAVKIRDESTKIIDVAFDFVFDSHEGFTRAFSKQFGITPKYYSKNTPPLKLFMPNNIRDYYLMLQKGESAMSKKTNNNTIFVQVIDRPERKLILKRGVKATHYFEYCEEIGCDVWGILSSIKEALYEPIGMWLPENLQTLGTSIYAQGVEVPLIYKGEVPEGFEIIELPACKMMVFQGQPYEDEKFEAAIEELWDVMKIYNPELYGFKWSDNDGPRFQLSPMGYRGYIEARPVRPINE